MIDFKKKKSKEIFKKISISRVLIVLGDAWIRIFPLVAVLLILTSIIIIFNIGYSSFYKSDLSDAELSSRVMLERKKNSFQKQEFDDIIKNIEIRKNEFKKNITPTNDIFFTSNILERMELDRKKED